jgi:hypothetical protein
MFVDLFTLENRRKLFILDLKGNTTYISLKSLCEEARSLEFKEVEYTLDDYIVNSNDTSSNFQQSVLDTLKENSKQMSSFRRSKSMEIEVKKFEIEDLKIYQLILTEVFQGNILALNDTIKSLKPELAVLRSIIFWCNQLDYRKSLMDEELVVQRLMSLFVAELLCRVPNNNLRVRAINRLDLTANILCVEEGKLSTRKVCGHGDLGVTLESIDTVSPKDISTLIEMKPIGPLRGGGHSACDQTIAEILAVGPYRRQSTKAFLTDVFVGRLFFYFPSTPITTTTGTSAVSSLVNATKKLSLIDIPVSSCTNDYWINQEDNDVETVTPANARKETIYFASRTVDSEKYILRLLLSLCEIDLKQIEMLSNSDSSNLKDISHNDCDTFSGDEIENDNFDDEDYQPLFSKSKHRQLRSTRNDSKNVSLKSSTADVSKISTVKNLIHKKNTSGKENKYPFKNLSWNEETDSYEKMLKMDNISRF